MQPQPRRSARQSAPKRRPGLAKASTMQGKYPVMSRSDNNSPIFLDDPRHEEYNDVQIAPSAYGGNGLFTKRRFKQFEPICQYWGLAVRNKDVSRKDYHSDYVFTIDNKWSVDAAYPDSCYARFVNDPIKIDRANAYFAVTDNEKLKMNAKVNGMLLEAFRTLQPGEEILAHYGNDFWAGSAYLYLSQEDRKIMYERSQRVRKFVNGRIRKKDKYYKLPPHTLPQDDDAASDPGLQPPDPVKEVAAPLGQAVAAPAPQAVDAPAPVAVAAPVARAVVDLTGDTDDDEEDEVARPVARAVVDLTGDTDDDEEEEEVRGNGWVLAPYQPHGAVAGMVHFIRPPNTSSRFVRRRVGNGLPPYKWNL